MRLTTQEIHLSNVRGNPNTAMDCARVMIVDIVLQCVAIIQNVVVERNVLMVDAGHFVLQGTNVLNGKFACMVDVYRDVIITEIAVMIWFAH